MEQGPGRTAGTGSRPRAMGFGRGYLEGIPPRAHHFRLSGAPPSRPVPARFHSSTRRVPQTLESNNPG